uniref:histidine kinase n=1 Tax=Cyanothece sp. (strain PCC 7425 / ATCC 29141) TaxID=395961 RepID=B8HKS2_CYAP4
MQHPDPGTTTLNEILITEELGRRSSRFPNWQAETQAMQRLARQMAEGSQSLIQTLVDTALDLCQAGTAGVSLLEKTPDGAEIFRWNALAGTLADHVGGSTPRHFSPCGVCLDQGVAVLLSHPEHYFTYFQEADTPIVEGLVLPLIANSHVFGTIWIMSHAEERQFDSEDVRVMTSLADFTATALLLQQHQTKELLAANAVLETEIADRKRSEDALRESEERFRTLANTAPALIWYNDAQGKNLFVNQHFLDFTGKSAEQIRGEGWHSLVHPDEAESYIADYLAAVREQRSWHNRNRIRRHDGVWRWHDNYAQPLFNADGVYLGHVGVTIDNTDVIEAEIALRESEAKYRTLFGSIDEGLAITEMIYDDQGEIVDIIYRQVNRAYERHGHVYDVVGRSIFDVIPGVEDYWLDLYKRVARTGESVREENYQQDVDRWFDVYFSRVDDNGRFVAIVFSDITDRKQREQRQAFLLKFSDTLRTEPNADAIANRALQMLIEELQLDRSYITSYYLEDNRADLNYQIGNDTVPPLPDHFVLSDFPEAFKATLKGTLVIEDDWKRQGLSEAEQRNSRNLGMRAMVAATLHKGENKPLWSMVGLSSRPRQWTPAEIALVEEVAERTWVAVERVRAEEALRKSEAEYRSLFTSIDEGFTLLEMIPGESGHPADFRIVETNPAWEQQTGLTDATGKTLLEIAPNFEQPLLDFYSDVVISGRGRRTEYYTAAVDRWYTVYASRIGGEGSRQVAAVFNDISDRKRTEEQQAFLLKFSDALRAEPDADSVANRAVRMLAEHLHLDRCWFSEVFEQQDIARIGWEYHRPDLSRTAGVYRLSDFPETMRQIATQPMVIHDVASDPDFADSEKALLAQLHIRALLVVSLRKGQHQVIWALISAVDTPRHWNESERVLLEQVSERTWAAIERARAEAALRESELQRIREQSAREEERQRAESLAELDHAKTLFFSNISHEFRTPLTLSLAPLQDALSDSSLSPVQRERLELAHRNSLRLLKLVNTLLDFSRIEAGRIEAVYEPTDLSLFTTELASVFRSAIERAGLQLIVDCPPLPEPVYVDREMWEKIVLNLLSNAFKFTFTGEITVTLRAESRVEQPASSGKVDDLTSELETSTGQVILEIRDTGTGIAAEHLPHLFERFYQVRGAQARSHEGSGIGLALVHELVQLQGGTIAASSTLGEGTCFTITLPFGTAHLPQQQIQTTRTLVSTALGAAPYLAETERWLPEVESGDAWIRDRTAGPSSPHRVLLVDDNADMRDYLTHILSKHVQVTAVADGAAALAAMQTHLPDLILSDVMMPGLDGFQLLQTLRADPRTREVPILLLSARAGQEAIVEGLQAGADDYLIKPFSAQELISRVNAHLHMAQLRGEMLQQERLLSKRKDELLSTVSHELNTPLVSILGWTRLLRTHPPSPSTLAKALDTIERNATLQAKLVQDLLDISRITTGKLQLYPQPLDLRTVIEAAIATVAHLAAAKGIELVFGGSSDQAQQRDGVVVNGDSDRLQQVVCNLLTNAIKFTPESGRVRIELSVIQVRDGGQIADTAYAQICVTDTGIGIAAHFLPHIFDRCTQADETHASKGLGLGLTIARHLVELHHGTIQAQSGGTGQGSRFMVRLPLAPGNPERYEKRSTGGLNSGDCDR